MDANPVQPSPKNWAGRDQLNLIGLQQLGHKVSVFIKARIEFHGLGKQVVHQLSEHAFSATRKNASAFSLPKRVACHVPLDFQRSPSPTLIVDV